MKVCLYRCFAADHRTSMDIYTDRLGAGLRQQGGCEVSMFRPSSYLERFNSNRHIMRFLRFWRYPRAVSRATDKTIDIHHVTDHGYAHLLPYLGAGKRFVTVHDLIPLLIWKRVVETPDHIESNRLSKPVLNLHALSFLGRYDHIIASSASTANDLEQYLCIDRNQISVVPPIISDAFKSVCVEKVMKFRRQMGMSPNVKWVMVSGREGYKNHATCLHVLKELLKCCDAPVKLVKTGLPSAEFDAVVAKLGLKDHVLQLFLEDIRDLPLVYNAVDCLLFPSLYEGFGLPVAEALACGTPVVTSNRGSLPELGGTFVPRLPPFDVVGLVSAVAQILSDPLSKTVFLEQGPNSVQRTRSGPVVRQLSELYQGVI